MNVISADGLQLETGESAPGSTDEQSGPLCKHRFRHLSRKRPNIVVRLFFQEIVSRNYRRRWCKEALIV